MGSIHTPHVLSPGTRGRVALVAARSALRLSQCRRRVSLACRAPISHFLLPGLSTHHSVYMHTHIWA